MSVSERAAREAAKELSTALVKYETDTGQVELSPQIIRDYLVNGQGRVTDQEVMLFLRLCQYQRLNPFLREAYLIKYGENQPATMVTGKEVFTKRAARHEACGGWEAGVLVLNSRDEVVERPGALALKSDKLVGGWAKVHRKDREIPTYLSVGFDEYAKTNKEGQLVKNWREMPATMIRKVALVQALREAFPDQLQGLYSEEEEAPITERTEATRIEAVKVVGASSAPRAEDTATPATGEQSAPVESASDPNAALPSNADERRAMFALAERLGLGQAAVAEQMKQFGKTKSADLTVGEVERICRTLEAVAEAAKAPPEEQKGLFPGGDPK